MRSKEKGNSSVIYKKRRLRGCEAGGVHHLDRVTAWPQAHWGGQWQHRDTGDAGGTLSPFVTPAQPSTHGNNHSSPFHPFSKLSFTLVLIFSLSPVWLPPSPRLSFLFWPPSFSLLFILHHSFSYSPTWLHTSDPLNHFTLSILKVCTLPMISQSLFCFAFYSWIWFTQPLLPVYALLSPIPFPLQNHPWYLFDCHQPEERWKSILPPATASFQLRRKGRQLAGL